MENVMFGLTRDDTMWLVLGMFVFALAVIIYAVIAPALPTLMGDKKSKLAKGAKGSEV